jgi:hypothetical protein
MGYILGDMKHPVTLTPKANFAAGFQLPTVAHSLETDLILNLPKNVKKRIAKYFKNSMAKLI